MLFRLRQTRYTRTRLISAVLAWGVLVGSLPLEISLVPMKSGAKPFACQHRACGCMSAEQCAAKCCCGPKKASTGITQADAGRDPGRGAYGKCCARNRQNRSESLPALANRGVADRVPKAVSSKLDSDARVRLLSSVQSRHCRGLLPLWMTLGDVCPPEPPVTLVAIQPGHERCECLSEGLAPMSLSPPVPPPRIA